MAIFNKPRFVRTTPIRKRKREMPEGLWTKCPACGEVLFNKDLEENLNVCSKCSYHFPVDAYTRILSLCDRDSFEELDAELRPVDVLKFSAKKSYAESLREYQERTGMNEAVVSGRASLEGIRISIAVMDFRFLGGTMGSVVGEKITRSIERAAEEETPLLVFSASGGARMHEGIFSLMQMAKTSGALNKLADKSQPFISVLTHPTLGGVTASFATLADIIIAEPRAMIGFAGARVIKDTTHAELPAGFQTAEFLLEHGLVDHIVHRREMRAQLSKLLRYMM